MGAAYFYHLTRHPLEHTLRVLLGKARQADWRVEVRGVDQDRMKRLDETLWLGPDDGFLPHGLAGGAHDADQPVLLTTSPDGVAGTDCLMAVDGADVKADQVNGLSRVCILFDGNTAAAVDRARAQWKTLTDAACPAQYWSEESGLWEMKSQK